MENRISKKAIIEVAKMLAKIHLLSKDKLPLKIRARKFIVSKKENIESLERLRNVLEKKECKKAFDKKIARHINQKIKLINCDVIKIGPRVFGKKHIIHADYNIGNIFFDKNDKLKYVFDWEMVSIAPRIMEIARAVDYICFDGYYDKKRLRRGRLFIDSYNKIYPIEKEQFQNGIRNWFRNKMMSCWALKEYYLKNRKDAKPFIEHEIRYLDCLSRDPDNFIEKFNFF